MVADLAEGGEEFKAVGYEARILVRTIGEPWDDRFHASSLHVGEGISNNRHVTRQLAQERREIADDWTVAARTWLGIDAWR